MNETNIVDMPEGRAVEKDPAVCIEVTPGICGFACVVSARRLAKKRIGIQIAETECKQLNRLSENLREMDWKDLFLPISRNPVYLGAQQSGCHPSCVLPAAVLKAAEVVMGMAFPRDVQFQFQPCKGQNGYEAQRDHTL